MVSIVPPSRGALVGKTYKDKAELKRKIHNNVIFFSYCGNQQNYVLYFNNYFILRNLCAYVSVCGFVPVSTLTMRVRRGHVIS